MIFHLVTSINKKEEDNIMLKKWKRICSIVCAAVLFVSGSFVVQNVKAANNVIEQTDNIAKVAYIGTEYQGLNGGVPTLEGYIFSGWYTQEDCGVANVLKEAPGDSDTVYAKFVKKDVLSVKVQLRYGTNMDSEYTKIRLITSVDSLNYQEVGFDFSCSTKTVYTTLFGYSSDSQQSYQPSSISTASNYFMVQNVTNFPQELFQTTITVTPKWTTLDGTTVAGEARTFKIQDVFGGGYGVGYKTLLSAETHSEYIQPVGTSSVQTSIDSDDKFEVVYNADVPTGTSCSAANVFLYQWNTSICSGKENAFFYIYNPTDNDVGCTVQMYTNTTETYPIPWTTLKRQQWTKIELPCATAEGGLRVYFPSGYTWNLNGTWKISSLFQKESTLVATEAGLDEHHDIYTFLGICNVELHKLLIVGEMEDYFQIGFERAHLKEGFSHTYELSIEDFYIHVLGHMAYHFAHGGVGIRLALDIRVYLDKYGDVMDREYIKQELQKAGLYTFACHAEKLAEIWFLGAESNEFYDELGTYIVESGYLGTQEHKEILEVVKQSGESVNEGARWKAIVTAIFPPYRTMAFLYPVLKKVPILLPFTWGARWINVFRKRRKNISRIQRLLHTQDDEVKRLSKLYDELDMKHLL